MSNPTVSPLAFANEGHEEILEATLSKHELVPVKAFRFNNSYCCRARSKSEKELFIKIKGLIANKTNLPVFKRSLTSNRAAYRINTGIIPALVEFRGFKKNGIYWTVTVDEYGGEPVCNRFFYAADATIPDDEKINKVLNALKTIQQTPTPSLFWAPEKISALIVSEFGQKVSSVAATWTSAHCDFHWGNILTQKCQVIDWETFALAPAGYDSACILFYSCNNEKLFIKLYDKLATKLDSESARVAIRFAGVRLLRMMQLDEYSDLQKYDEVIRNTISRLIQ